MRISDWSSDVCSSDLRPRTQRGEWPQLPALGRGDADRLGRAEPGAARRHFRTESALARRFRRCHRDRRPLRRCRIAHQGDLLAGTAHLAGCRNYRSEEHTSELPSLIRISFAVFCLKKKKTTKLKI